MEALHVLPRRLTRGAGALGLIGAAFLVAGCPNVANLTTARVNKPGTHEITVAPAVYGMPAGVFNADGDGGDGGVMAGTVDLGYRAGLVENVDLGVRLSNWGNINLDVKIGLVDEEAVRLALDPTIGGVFFGAGSVSAGYFQFDLPVLVDIALSERFAITVGPRYTMLGFFGGGESAFQHYVGTTFGVEIALGDTFAIQPHGGMMFGMNRPQGVNSMIFTGMCPWSWYIATTTS
jgi:hypothetical protein